MKRLVFAFASTGSVLLIVSGAIIFISVVLRKFFATQIPDTNDFSRLIMGIAIMVGIAIACLRGQQITMDTVWSMIGRTGKRGVDAFATAFTAVAIGSMTWMLLVRIVETYQSREVTFDVRVPIWYFYGVVGIAAVLATIFTVIRLWRILRGDNSGEPTALQGEAPTIDYRSDGEA